MSKFPYRIDPFQRGIEMGQRHLRAGAHLLTDRESVCTAAGVGPFVLGETFVRDFIGAEAGRSAEATLAQHAAVYKELLWKGYRSCLIETSLGDGDVTLDMADPDSL